jgi:hypothetical protein
MLCKPVSGRIRVGEASLPQVLDVDGKEAEGEAEED